jgi:hypothetical protein
MSKGTVLPTFVSITLFIYNQTAQMSSEIGVRSASPGTRRKRKAAAESSSLRHRLLPIELQSSAVCYCPPSSPLSPLGEITMKADWPCMFTRSNVSPLASLANRLKSPTEFTGWRLILSMTIPACN